MNRMLPDGCIASFKDIIAIHSHEAEKPLKIASCLTTSSLDP
jgi:hypothetical protein